MTQKSFLQKLQPINIDQEKDKFFFDQLYNPQFQYEDFIGEEELYTYGAVSHEYLNKAEHIIQQVLKKYETESSYFEQTGGRVLTRQEVDEIIGEYLEKYHLETEIQSVFSQEFTSRTSVWKNQLRIRLPIQYREDTIQGMLHHEVGTHYFRRLNEIQQPWYRKHKSFGLNSYLSTEEGLATLHSKINASEKHLWSAALSYYIVCQAEKLSFSELWEDLKKFVDDGDRRWKYCVKAKRGIMDTSRPGAFSRGQLYFVGVVKVVEWLETHSFDARRLYIGKVALEDLEKVEKIQSNIHLRMPTFLTSEHEQYKKQMREIVKCNALS